MTPVLENGTIIMLPLTDFVASSFYNLYSNTKVQAHFSESPFLNSETAEEFTKRILSVCDHIWTIRHSSLPDLVIGDCALHHYSSETYEVEVGGSLLPEYWGMGIMMQAFELAMNFAATEMHVKTIIARTTHENEPAIRLVEKMGFMQAGDDQQEACFTRQL